MPGMLAAELEAVMHQNPEYFGDSAIADAVAAVCYRLRHVQHDALVETHGNFMRCDDLTTHPEHAWDPFHTGVHVRCIGRP